MSSTAIVIRQLGEQAELNRTHGRIAFGILLFQDLAFVPFLALEGALAGSAAGPRRWEIAGAILQGGGRAGRSCSPFRPLALRPLFHEIGRARSAELFTLAALLVALGAAWATHAVGLSLALGAFLAGMLLAETEYRHQVEAVIRPFRDVLLGLFFVTIGMLLDLQLLVPQLLAGAAAGRRRCSSSRRSSLRSSRALGTGQLRKALRAGIVVAQGGEFGFALLTLMLNDMLAGAAIIQPLLAATVVSMVLSPLLIRHNGRIAELLLRAATPRRPRSRTRGGNSALGAARSRDHLRLWPRRPEPGARAGAQGFEYIALDLDPRAVELRGARAMRSSMATARRPRSWKSSASSAAACSCSRSPIRRAR